MAVRRVGRYEVVQLIGRGASGDVCLARDPVIDRLVALKTLRLDLGPDEDGEFRPRFLREARAAGRLSHPGIVTIFDAGEDAEQGLLFIAMEYVEGRSLRQHLEAGLRPDAARVAELGIRLAEALDYAHRNGVVHRDIKPANIILTPAGEPKIADFGIARLALSEHTVEGTVIGTPSFMSPEQADGSRVDGRTDLYSLGVVLFQLLTGTLPFGPGTLTEMSMRIVSQPPPDVATLRPDLGPGFPAVVRRCLAKRPEDRFQTGAELAEALRHLGGGPSAGAVGVPARAAAAPSHVEDVFPATPRPRHGLVQGDFGTVAAVTRPMPRRRRPLALGGAVVLLLGLLGGLYLLVSGDGPGARWPASVLAERAVRPLLDDAAGRLQRGDLEGAIAAANAALEKAPGSPEALATLAEARRRLELQRIPASITVDFTSPSSRGSISVALDGKPLDAVSWDFTRKVIFGITKRDKGKVHALLTVPPGRHELRVALAGEDGAALGETTFDEVFGPASFWTLDVQPPAKKGRMRILLRQRPAVAPSPPA